MSHAARPVSSLPADSSGARLVSVDGRSLPLLGAALKADGKAGVMRVTLEQTFRNPHDEPLRVTYSLPLPADAAVSGFAFTLGQERIVGQVDSKARARERFEDAVLRGQSAALLDQERSSLFTQEVGNVPPRSEIVCELQLDQRLAWLPDGFWEWRFPTVVAPRYLGAPGRVADAAKVTVDVADQALPVRLSLALSIRDRLAEGARPMSPSHALHTEALHDRVEVRFADERGAALDRDVVVRFRAAQPRVGLELDVSRAAAGSTSRDAFGLLTLVPPAQAMAAVPRDLIVLLDTSGSMSGAPLQQAQRVTAALIDSLTDGDRLELIEFSNSPRRWKSGAVQATASNRKDAQGWVARLRASGGTEMRSGILEALQPLRAESQRQVVLITDGLIGSEHEVLEAIGRRLPAGSRVHTVGVGSGVNRSLTGPAARAGRGVELVVGLGEDVEPLIARLLSRTHAPLWTEVSVSGSAVVGAPTRIADLFGGAPALIPLALRAEGGELMLRAKTAQGDLVERLAVGAVSAGEGSPAVRALFAREAVEDLELDAAIDGQSQARDAEIERLGLEFQISTRLTSWVAISAQQTVDPRAPRRHETMPHELAYGLSAEGFGLRQQTELAPAVGAVRVRQAAFDDSVASAAMEPLREAPMRDEGFAMHRRVPTAGPRAESAGAPPPARPAAPAPATAAPSGPPAKAKKELSRGDLAEREKQRRAPVRTLRGAARRSGRLLIVTFEPVSALDWNATTATLVLVTGAHLTQPFDASLTTAAGPVQPGVVVTVVFTLEAGAGDVASLTITLASGELLEIVL